MLKYFIETSYEKFWLFKTSVFIKILLVIKNQDETIVCVLLKCLHTLTVTQVSLLSAWIWLNVIKHCLV